MAGPGKALRARPVHHPALEALRGKRVHVLGISGTEGSAVAEFLLAQGIDPVCHDLQTPEDFPEAFHRTHQWMEPGEREDRVRWWLEQPVRWRARYLEGIEDAEVVFLPQAWFRRPENARVRELLARGLRAHSLTQLVLELAPCPVVGVTGTNGKFTVVTLIERILNASGLRTYASGNDRTHVPAVYFLHELGPDDRLVLELSNRQLLGIWRSPPVAVITNVSVHHLDDHGSFEAYADCKARIFQYQGPQDVLVANLDDPVTWSLAKKAPSRVVPFGVRAREGAWLEGDWICWRDRRVLPRSDLPVLGQHAASNALAACAAAAVAGGTVEAMAAVLREFRGLPHRLWLVDEIAGVRYYEDSLATNPAAAAAAVAAMERPFVLIAGGRRPQATRDEFEPLRQALRTSPVRAVYLIGESAPVLRQALRGLAAEVLEVRSLPQAFRRAVQLARPGEAVLLSPGCESFDQFADYRERAELFAALVAQERRKRAG
ncbi:MAG: UDP-N-acetylmuramoyl-L-alanine--D-glutamate ligase [Armatimonadota bacterium]|nr:UDP-N-acetylmuramoyl-L-alanine--D-glutamate ligase [Armatimonadota bacterium]MDR7476208.1 UDP-N-acetylmuramoyl-L-alanine--D-glutamate ligase [Armatimonadota bacterium]MDR7513678.1 UDP-N-acetylmuramoyl-L-alanine--D-glutamate ligase [Armatimonadota bacterium]MDR7524277.1 UDP-N-acetylmuramoyl-L-alanine--D-glutamate ligase [Armatimonadota bacterium]MDR7541693.1 UDP-N-acetylmuramoyl-L-alanine--D-glutamate ligase [Armatimonadota bacterium]